MKIVTLHIDPYPKMQITAGNRGRKQASRPLYLCPKCNKPWHTWSCGKRWEHLWDGFPKIGCEPKICPDCKNQ